VKLLSINTVVEQIFNAGREQLKALKEQAAANLLKASGKTSKKATSSSA